MNLLKKAAVAVSLLLAALAAGLLLLWGTGWDIPEAETVRLAYELSGQWDGSEFPAGPLERPIGIAVAPNGDVYVSDARKRVLHLSPSGQYLGEWGREGDGPGLFSNPIGVTVTPDGSVLVSDYDLDRVQKFTATGEFLLQFGTSGSDPGQFDAPAGLAAKGNFVYVADFYNHRVQKFSADGTIRQVIGHAGRVGDGALHYPTDVDLTPEGELLVADAYNYQLQWFDPQGKPLGHVGSHLFWIWPRPASSTAGFNVPSGAAVGPDGLIHVADSGNRRVVLLSGQGAWIAHWSLPDPNPNVFSPEHVAVSPDGGTVYATDLSANRILVLKVVR